MANNRPKYKIRKDDVVVVLAGKDRGRTGRVVRILSLKDRVLVEGVNMVRKHVKGTHEQPGRIEERESVGVGCQRGIGEGQLLLLGERSGNRVVAAVATTHEYVTEAAAGVLLILQRRLEVSFFDPPGPHQQVTEQKRSRPHETTIGASTGRFHWAIGRRMSEAFGRERRIRRSVRERGYWAEAGLREVRLVVRPVVRLAVHYPQA